MIKGFKTLSWIAVFICVSFQAEAQHWVNTVHFNSDRLVFIQFSTGDFFRAELDGDEGAYRITRAELNELESWKLREKNPINRIYRTPFRDIRELSLLRDLFAASSSDPAKTIELVDLLLNAKSQKPLLFSGGNAQYSPMASQYGFAFLAGLFVSIVVGASVGGSTSTASIGLVLALAGGLGIPFSFRALGKINLLWKLMAASFWGPLRYVSPSLTGFAFTAVPGCAYSLISLI
jgi:hypothetical protein